MKKLIDYYVKLYIGNDNENGNPRIETKRFWYIIWHLIWVFIIGTGIFEIFFEAVGKITGVLK